MPPRLAPRPWTSRDAEFLSGGDLHFSGQSPAAVVNLGDISAGLGSIYLIAQQVTNSGSLSAPSGTVGLAAGTQVTLTENGTEHVLVTSPVTSSWNRRQRRCGAQLRNDPGGPGRTEGRRRQPLRPGDQQHRGRSRDGKPDDRRPPLSQRRTRTPATSPIPAPSRGQYRRSGGSISVAGGSANGTLTIGGTIDASATGANAAGGQVTVTAANVNLSGGRRGVRKRRHERRHDPDRRRRPWRQRRLGGSLIDPGGHRAAGLGGAGSRHLGQRRDGGRCGRRRLGRRVVRPADEFPGSDLGAGRGPGRQRRLR